MNNAILIHHKIILTINIQVRLSQNIVVLDEQIVTAKHNHPDVFTIHSTTALLILP